MHTVREVLTSCLREFFDFLKSEPDIHSSHCLISPFLQHPQPSPDLTTAFGGRRSIQLSYGCIPESDARSVGWRETSARSGTSQPGKWGDTAHCVTGPNASPANAQVERLHLAVSPVGKHQPSLQAGALTATYHRQVDFNLATTQTYNRSDCEPKLSTPLVHSPPPPNRSGR